MRSDAHNNKNQDEVYRVFIYFRNTSGEYGLFRGGIIKHIVKSAAGFVVHRLTHDQVTDVNHIAQFADIA
jgi:hypothetical protein